MKDHDSEDERSIPRGTGNLATAVQAVTLAAITRVNGVIYSWIWRLPVFFSSARRARSSLNRFMALVVVGAGVAIGAGSLAAGWYPRRVGAGSVVTLRNVWHALNAAARTFGWLKLDRAKLRALHVAALDAERAAFGDDDATRACKEALFEMQASRGAPSSSSFISRCNRRRQEVCAVPFAARRRRWRGKLVHAARARAARARREPAAAAAR